MENIQVPMREYFDLSQRLMDELARVKLDLVGLGQSVVIHSDSLTQISRRLRRRHSCFDRHQ